MGFYMEHFWKHWKHFQKKKQPHSFCIDGQLNLQNQKWETRRVEKLVVLKNTCFWEIWELSTRFFINYLCVKKSVFLLSCSIFWVQFSVFVFVVSSSLRLLVYQFLKVAGNPSFVPISPGGSLCHRYHCTFRIFWEHP